MLCAWTHPESPKHSIHHQPECAAAMPSFIQFTRPATGNLVSHMEQTRSLLHCRICTRNQHDFIHRWMQICRPRLLSACAHKQRIATFFSSRIHTGRHTIFMFNHFECRANGPQTHTHIAQNSWHQLTDQHHLSVSNCRLHSNFKYRKINHNSLECHTQNKPICACNSTAAMLQWNI